ncbi:hypothetical protein GCM10017744_010870 [Streptomyces antimycoticus]|uniref:hypothetical protein n=1 Tax=Streptomyces antimycoticus TaxID=68175 RepID=UPI001387032F
MSVRGVLAGRGGDGRSAPGHGRPRIVVRRLMEALPSGSAQSAVVVRGTAAPSN